MARAKKQISPLEQEYRKQRRRVQQFLRRAEKRGYQFLENTLPERPKRITKKSVERLQKLTPEKLYKKSTYGGEATYGEVIKGTKGRELERKRSAEKSAETRRRRKEESTYVPAYTETYYEPEYEELEVEKKSIDDLKRESKLNFIKDTVREDNINTDSSFYTRIVIDNFRITLNAYNEKAKEKLNGWLNTLVTQYGNDDVAQMITTAIEDGVELTVKDSYFLEKVSDYMQKMMDYLPEAGEFTKESILESLEEEDIYTEPT